MVMESKKAKDAKSTRSREGSNSKGKRTGYGIDGCKEVSFSCRNKFDVSDFFPSCKGSCRGYAWLYAGSCFPDDSLEKFSSKHMAFNIKKEFDQNYGPAWHCIVGSGFGSYVTYSTGCFLYFSIEKMYILLFKTKVQKALDTHK